MPERPISATGWLAWVLLGILTFAGFMFIDPEPSLLLAASMAANMMLLLWALYRLYSWNLLFSPMAAIIIGPSWPIVLYTWGNIGARVAGEGRFGSNPGSLEWYPVAALLTTFGLFIYCWVTFGLFRQPSRRAKIRFENLRWDPWQTIAAGVLAAGILIYLSSKYEFDNGYFIDLRSELDRWLAASYYSIVTLVTLIGTSVLIQSNGRGAKLVGLIGVLLPIAFSVGLRSRTAMLQIVSTIAVAWIVLRPRHTRTVLLVSAIIGVIVFVYGTAVKVFSVQMGTSSISENFTVATTSELGALVQANNSSAELDFQYRVAGLEYPSAILNCLYVHGRPMYGEGMAGGFLQGLPGFLRPAGQYSEALAIQRHFSSGCLLFADSIGVLLTSGLADWGLVSGVFIYVIYALACQLVWRVAQASPRLFVAYIITGFAANYLFWDGAFYAVRSIGFSWIILFVFAPLLMPRWEPEAGRDPAQPRRSLLSQRWPPVTGRWS